jgi:hypothetical protein
MRYDIYKDGKRFSSEYQPPNESKRVPKWRHQMKKAFLAEFESMYKACVKEVKETGNYNALDKMLDRLYGKVKDEVSLSGDLDITVGSIEEIKKKLKDAII